MNTISIQNKVIALFSFFRLLFIKAVLKIKYFLNSKNLVLKRGDFYIKYHNDGDDQELLYIANWEKYFNEEYTELLNLIKPGSNVIDIGANLGFFSLMLSKLVGKTGKVYCFEPSNTIYNKLVLNLKLNSSLNVIPFNLGIGEKEENLILRRNKKYSGLSTIVLEQNNKVSEEKIKITSLDKHFSENNIKIDLVKIDTEGFEPLVLAGATHFLKVHKPIVYIELGGGKFLMSSKKAMKILLECGYKFTIDESDLCNIPAGKNFVAVPSI